MSEKNDAQLFFFDPITIVLDVLKHWYFLIVVSIVCGLLAFVVSDMTYQPRYQTTATMVVSARDSSSTVYTNLSSTSDVASVFSEIINSSVLKKQIFKDANITSFNGSIRASRIAETNLLKINVTSTNPKDAFLVMKAIIEHHDSITYQVIDGIALEVLSSPKVPTAPMNPTNAFQTMEKAMILSFILGCLVIAIQSGVKNVVRNKSEAEKKLNCWCLGEIKHERKNKTIISAMKNKKRAILINHPSTSFHYVETFHKLRRRIEQNTEPHEKTLMITSLMENEGKSTVAVNLALAYAKKKERVLLVDLDLYKPACHKILEQKRILHDVQDVMNGVVPLSQAIVQDEMSGLHLLLNPIPLSKSSSLINDQAIGHLLEEARELYDVIILDLPPMSAALDSQLILDYVDISLLVVRQNQARVPVLNRAIATLNEGKAKLVGCVLNNVYTSTQLVDHYGHDNYSKYGHYTRNNK